MIKVLLIEDDPEQIMLFQMRFSLADMVLLTADKLENVMATLDTGRPDIMLIDILLHGRNGLDILEAVRGNERYKDIPAVIFSNYETPETHQRAESLGALRYVIKSQTDPSAMVESIRCFVETGVFE